MIDAKHLLNMITDYIVYNNSEISKKYTDKIVEKAMDMIGVLLTYDMPDEERYNLSSDFIFFCLEHNLSLSNPINYNSYKLGMLNKEIIMSSLYFQEDLYKITHNIDDSLNKILIDLNSIKKGGVLGLKLGSRRKGNSFRNNVFEILNFIKNDEKNKVLNLLPEYLHNDKNKQAIESIVESGMLKEFEILKNITDSNFDINKNYIILESDERNKKIFNDHSDFTVKKGLDIIINVGNPHALGLPKRMLISGEAKQINQSGGSQTLQFKNMMEVANNIGNATRGIGFYSGTAIFKKDPFSNKLKDALKEKKVFLLSDLLFDFDSTVTSIVTKENK